MIKGLEKYIPKLFDEQILIECVNSDEEKTFLRILKNVRPILIKEKLLDKKKEIFIYNSFGKIILIFDIEEQMVWYDYDNFLALFKYRLEKESELIFLIFIFLEKYFKIGKECFVKERFYCLPR